MIETVVVVVTLFIQGGPFSYEAGIQRGPVSEQNTFQILKDDVKSYDYTKNRQQQAPLHEKTITSPANCGHKLIIIKKILTCSVFPLLIRHAFSTGMEIIQVFVSLPFTG